ncbi:bifunctional lysylphosphatidylglycerol flippase/synthetase MprF [Agromyces arachidis]|uniref:bifunctional lysylphosphatidylglycerol flippase/synthetase MprF n=1 Tax=Agromyces arachidis TaxID=766966 RepID=UPI004057448E
MAARVPFTIALAAALVVVGVVSGGFAAPATDAAWYDAVAYGVPSFEAGRWWTVATGTFVVNEPWGYLLLAAIVPAGVGWLEARRGTRVAAAGFAVGQAGAVLGTALVVVVLAALGSPWARGLAEQLDAGPSGGVLACATLAAFSLAAPWRGRVVVALVAFSAVSVLFLGTLADVEHAVAVVGVLALHVRSFTRPTLREQRFIAWTALLAIGAAQLVLALVPTSGPFGASDPGGVQVVDVAIDAAVVLLLANGLRRGFRVAWIATLVLAGFNLAIGALALALLTLGRADAPDEIEAIADALTLATATAVLWLLLVAWLVATRHAYRARLRRRLPGARDAQRPGALADSARQTIREVGGGPLSWMATWPDNRILIGSEPGALVAYQTHQGVAIALSDPIAPPGGMRRALADFVDEVERAGFVACVFGATDRAKEAMPDGWRAVQIAEDTIVDLPGLAFTGKPWSAARQALNRADREGVTFRFGTLADEPFRIRAQVDAISARWVGGKDLPEMRFTLGTVDEALDPAVRMAFAEHDGTVEGFLSWLPVYREGGEVDGWTLDLMRRRDGGFGPVMEFLIAASAAAFRDEGARFLSLSGAPLARSTPAAPDELSPVDALLDRLGGMLEPAYGFRSLHRFKQKFNPRPEPLHLLYRDGGDLARIGLGLTRAYLPDASVAALVRAGVQLTR